MDDILRVCAVDGCKGHVKIDGGSSVGCQRTFDRSCALQCNLGGFMGKDGGLFCSPVYWRKASGHADDAEVVVRSSLPHSHRGLVVSGADHVKGGVDELGRLLEVVTSWRAPIWKRQKRQKVDDGLKSMLVYHYLMPDFADDIGALLQESLGEAGSPSRDI